MEQAAARRGMECKIEALFVSVFKDAIQHFDVCLLGPQVRFQLEGLKKVASQYGKQIDVIPPLAYGMMKYSIQRSFLSLSNQVKYVEFFILLICKITNLIPLH